MNKAFILVVLTFVFLLTKDCFASDGYKVQPSLLLNADKINISFRSADALVLSDYKGNKEAFARLNRIICSHKNSYTVIDSILVCGYASPDGFIDNDKLSEKRALATKECLLWMYPILNSIPINTVYKVVRWSDIACFVKDDVRIPNRDKTLNILQSGKRDETIEANLKNLSGDVYNYLKRNILPKCQIGISCI